MSAEKAMQIETYTKFIMAVIAGELVARAINGTEILQIATKQTSGVHKS